MLRMLRMLRLRQSVTNSERAMSASRWRGAPGGRAAAGIKIRSVHSDFHWRITRFLVLTCGARRGKLGSVGSRAEIYPKGHAVDALEPLYTLEVAIELIPMSSMQSLYVFLSNHRDEFPARYRWSSRYTPQRILTRSECERIRAMTVLEASDPSMAFMKRRGRKRSILDTIIARATA